MQEKPGNYSIGQTLCAQPPWRKGLVALLGIVMLAVSQGCARVTAQQQRLVSKPNMQFSGSAVFTYQDKLLSQVESGSSSFGGGQSAGCVSCGVR